MIETNANGIIGRPPERDGARSKLLDECVVVVLALQPLASQLVVTDTLLRSSLIRLPSMLSSDD